MRAIYSCRDIGYGIEGGEVLLPPIGDRDWTGKREYAHVEGHSVYLFDDEIKAIVFDDEWSDSTEAHEWAESVPLDEAPFGEELMIDG